MKKQNNLFLTILGILFLSLGISVACSLSDDKDPTDDPSIGNTPTVDLTVDPDLLAQFKANYVGSYTVNPTAVVLMDGRTMIFNNTLGILAMLLEDDMLWLLLAYSGGSGESEVTQFSFIEGEPNESNTDYMQEIIGPVTSTNITLKNSEITFLTEFFGQGSTVDLMINLDTGFLYLNGVKIGTKNP